MIQIESEVQTNHIKFDFDLIFKIRKIRERNGLKYQVVLKNNNNGNELPIKQTEIAAKLKMNTKRIVSDYTAATIKKIIDEEQGRFDKMLEQFLEDNQNNHTRAKKNNTI